MNDVKLLPKICKLLRHSHKLQIRYMIQYIDHHSDSLLYYHCRHLLKILCQLILCLVRSLALTFKLFTILKESINVRSISSSPCSPWFSNSRLIVFNTHQLNSLFFNSCHFMFSQLLIGESIAETGV